jgi:NADPH:quinone reductase-like Zn-dependent oxidoreductase
MIGREETMKAVVYHEYGQPDVLTLETVPKPEVGDDGVVIRVRAASVNPYDYHMTTGTPYLARIGSGFRRPKRNGSGADVAGVVEAVGSEVTELQAGDEVYGELSGAFAEYARGRERSFAIKPATMSFEEAAAVPMAALTALQGLRDKGDIESGHHVLVVGASGGVGTYAVQIAKSFGAEVTAVCSTRNIDMVRSLGADHVIDYTKEDFAHNGRHYDLILDAVGRRSVIACKRVLSPAGVYVAAGSPKTSIGAVSRALRLALASLFGRKKMSVMLARMDKGDLEFLAGLADDGKLMSIIDRRFALSEVPDAVRYVAEGHSRGKSVINVSP